MDAALAREIIAQALEDETHEGTMPEDDDKAIETAEGLVQMAKDAWEQNIQGPEVEAILKLAERAEDENGSSGKKDKPAAKAKPAGRPKKADPEPEPEDEPADSRASEEPWEAYDSDKVADILEGLEVWAEQEEFDSVLHILLYEEANKNRKKIVDAATAALPEDMIPGEQVSGEVEPEGDDDAEPEPEPEAESNEPYEGYDSSKMVEIKESINAMLEDEEMDDEDKLAALQATYDYEALNKTRTGMLDFLDEKISSYKEQDDDEEGETEEEGEAEGAAASADDSGDEEGAEGGESDSKSARSAAGKRSGSSTAAKGRSSSEPDASDDAALLESVHELIARERLHIPEALEEDPVELPFDLTTVSDTELQQLYSAFNAYSYRAGYLLMLEEAKGSKYREAADEIVQAYLASSESDASVTAVKAQAEEHDDVKAWRRKQRRAAILADALRKERDSYDKVCERLSRIETMRQDEWQRSGGGPASRGSRPGKK